MSSLPTRPLRICLIASSRFAVAEPFVGGLEAHTHALARHLIARGHSVSLFAAPGSDPALNLHPLPVDDFAMSEQARADVGARPDDWMREHHAYLALMLDLANTAGDRFDVIHNNSLHHLPIAMASALTVPMVTTLHTPPIAWLESAARFATSSVRFVAVSESTAAAWRPVVESTVVRNGIDTERWVAGPGGERAVWFGRIVPEKGAHLAVRAARIAGLDLDLAGPILDPGYFAEMIEPELGDGVRYLGHRTHAELVSTVGRAAVAVITPCWDEPFGLTAAEALACGTPVAAFSRGALPEIVDASSGRLVAGGDVEALAGAMLSARHVSRDAARRRAVEQCSLDRMVDAYENLYVELSAPQREGDLVLV